MADEDIIPIGKRFDHLYIDQGKPDDDSERMRRRLGAVLHKLQIQTREQYRGILEEELGVIIPIQLNVGIDAREFFLNAKLRDVLSSVTIIWEAAPLTHKEGWLENVARIFREENTCYRVDERGGVHPVPDEEYERNRVATIAALAPARYRAALEDFEKVQEALNEQPPDLTEGIYRTFLAIENVFKLMCPDANRLSEGQIKRHLSSVIENYYSDDDTAKGAAKRLCDGLKDWVNSAQDYRHSQGNEEPKQPPSELAILIMSSGAAFLRWLAQIDQSRAQ